MCIGRRAVVSGVWWCLISLRGCAQGFLVVSKRNFGFFRDSRPQHVVFIASFVMVVLWRHELCRIFQRRCLERAVLKLDVNRIFQRSAENWGLGKSMK